MLPMKSKQSDINHDSSSSSGEEGFSELSEEEMKRTLQPPENEAKYPITNAIGSGTGKIATGLRKIPSVMFNARNEPKEQNAFKQYLDETPTNVADGLFKGVLSVGNGLFQGITGLVVEPVRHAKKDGVAGFARGVGKGLTGVVLKPVAGVIDFAGKTTQGIINTPISVYEAIKANNEENESLKKMISINSKGKIFGIPLEESFSYTEHAKIPHIALEAINYLNDFVKEEGLFRVSGNANLISELKNQVDKGGNVVLTKENLAYGPHEVAGLLKLYLRALPDPLLTSSRYPSFLYIQQHSQKSEERGKAYKAVIESLPAINKVLLRKLMTLLKVVSDHADVNFMKASNLATVFGPALLRSPDDDFSYVDAAPDPQAQKNPQQVFLEVSLSIGVVNELIDHYDYLFNDITP